MRIKNFIIIVFTIVFSCAGCFPDREAGGDPASRLESPEASLVKLVPVVFGGNRYVVEADFGLARKVPLMVHGNAGFYLMLTHEIAEQLNGGSPVAKIRDFGYSDKGMGRIDVEEFRIGAHNVWNDIVNWFITMT